MNHNLKKVFYYYTIIPFNKINIKQKTKNSQKREVNFFLELLSPNYKNKKIALNVC